MNELTYEQAMQKLEEMASQMEQGEIGIDEMAQRLCEAQKLMKYCHEKLYEAEKNCQSLLNVEEKA
jgi:exodeoxyribonuclease VII small subunit